MSSKKGLGFSRKTGSCLDFSNLNLNFDFDNSETHLSARNLMNQIRDEKKTKSTFQKSSVFANSDNKNDSNNKNIPCVVINYCENN